MRTLYQTSTREVHDVEPRHGCWGLVGVVTGVSVSGCPCFPVLDLGGLWFSVPKKADAEFHAALIR